MWSVRWRWPGRLWQIGYGMACWVLMGVVGGSCWVLVVSLPKLSWRWRATRVAVRLLSIGLRIPVKVTGTLPARGTPCVIVANHASILDSFALVDVFPDPVVFVAGGDLAGHRVTGPFLRGLGSVFVRLEGSGNRSALRSVLGELTGVAAAGKRPVFFPEGGLDPELGLRRFQLGAFLVAGEANCVVVPLAITGTRQLLPPGARLPRRSPVEVRIGQVLLPAGPDWADARTLARDARRVIEGLLVEGGVAEL
jgi:1-acyl-sn-glycerol-3-phosphate acyltransferase